MREIKGHYILDARVGCVAVYQEPMRACLSGVQDVESCLFYRHGYKDDYGAWQVAASDLDAAQLIADLANMIHQLDLEIAALKPTATPRPTPLVLEGNLRITIERIKQ